MMTVFVTVGAIASIFFAGAFSVDWTSNKDKDSRTISLVLLAFGLFGIYALIVGK